jgi:mono/diheme cytochrome c family protein
MPHLSELHGASTHLAIVGLPLYALLLILRRRGRAARSWEPWVLGASALGIAGSGLTGLLVRGQSQTELRDNGVTVGSVHFWLGIAIAVAVLGLAAARARGRSFTALATVALVAVLTQGYLGGRMTYEHGIGVQALGEARRTAAGAAQLQVSLAKGTGAVAAGRQAFGRTGLGCASCHGDQAEGDRGPRLAGGRHLDEFRRVHAAGLFPAAVVTDRDFAAINAYLRSVG